MISVCPAHHAADRCLLLSFLSTPSFPSLPHYPVARQPPTCTTHSSTKYPYSVTIAWVCFSVGFVQQLSLAKMEKTIRNPQGGGTRSRTGGGAAKRKPMQMLCGLHQAPACKGCKGHRGVLTPGTMRGTQHWGECLAQGAGGGRAAEGAWSAGLRGGGGSQSTLFGVGMVVAPGSRRDRCPLAEPEAGMHWSGGRVEGGGFGSILT